MADAIVGATVQVLLKNALPLVTDRIPPVLGFKQDLERFKESAEMVQAYLADAEHKQTHNKAVQLWLKGLEKSAFNAYYVLDEVNYEFLRRQVKSRKLRRQVKSRKQLEGKLCSFFFCSNISFRWRMSSKFRSFNIELENIHQQATNYGLRSSPLLSATTKVTICRQTDSTASRYVVGRESDESNIVEMLLSDPQKLVSVIPIVGMGGLGKTTLAKSVYNNKKIDRHFSKKIWICVSENFEVVELFKLILESLRGNKVEMFGRDVVVQQIRKELEGKRYLLVLDDVWNTIADRWESFFDSLVGLSTVPGSKCLVTTRLQNVASIVSGDPPYVLQKLSDDDCWGIIEQKVIERGEMPEELSGIKMQITKKCNGLPLAANVIGGLLGRESKEHWQSIVEKMLLNMGGDHESSIMQILKLSFDHLPSPIKKCFAYCSIFDKDEEMNRNILIELWMAEGFLQSDVQNEITMEEIGAKYFNNLLHSSLLEETKDSFRGTCYKMHDLVHDLAQSISKLQHLNSENDVINNSYQVRSLAIAISGEKMKVQATSHSASILNSDSRCKEILWKFKHLHTLNLSKAYYITVLPSSIGKLKHLRFLSVSHRMTGLPESICKLLNLQTLRIGEEGLSPIVDALPQETSNLISLRHLYLFTRDAKFKMPVNMGRLNCLQTLKFFNVGQEDGRRIEELGSLKDLKGDLQIRNLELVKDREETARANLSGKQNLTNLAFCWRSGAGEENGDIHGEQVLDGLKPHPNVKALRIKSFMGDRFPQWLVNLSKLDTLALIGCEKCSELPELGHLQCLKTLELESMRSLKEWKEAEVDDDDDVGVFPLLEHLSISHCSQLTIAPSHFPSLKCLRIYGSAKVSAVKSILSKATTLTSLRLTDMDGLICLSDVLGSCSTSLKELVLEFCRDLIELPEYLLHSQSLGKLWIRGCPKIVHVGSSRATNYCLASLEVFCVFDCEGLITIAAEILDCCTFLRVLDVSGCPNLVSFPLNFLQTPNVLSISFSNCPKLFIDKNNMPRGFRHLIVLKRVSIGPFFQDDCSIELFDWDGLMFCSSTLRDLHITLCGLLHMESLLPDQLQLFTSLKYLRIWMFGLLESLPDWLGNLESLEKLEVYFCVKLRYLPSVPALRRLTKLKELEFHQCPLMKERSSPESGTNSEWSKISQLPSIKTVNDPEFYASLPKEPPVSF